MLHGTGQHIGDGLDATVPMPGKAGQIVFRNVIAKVIKQEKRVEVFGISEPEGPAQMYARSFQSRFGFDQLSYRSDRHNELQSSHRIPVHVAPVVYAPTRSVLFGFVIR